MSFPSPIIRLSEGCARESLLPELRRDARRRHAWFTLKDTGKVQVFDAKPPFALLKTIDTGPITNHVNFARNAHGQFAYVTIGGLYEIKVFRTDDFSLVATILGKLPHGVWPSGDGSRVYVGLENDDELIAVDTLTNKAIAAVPIGQGPQAVVYVPDAVPEGAGTEGLQPLGVAGQAARPRWRRLASRRGGRRAPTSVTLFDQGLVQVLEASVTGLEPKHPYVLALATSPDGSGALKSLSSFTTNPAGAAIVNAIGPIRQIVRGEAETPRRYLVILPGSGTGLGKPVQIQVP